MSHGISLSQGARVGLGTDGYSADSGFHLHLNCILLVLRAVISPALCRDCAHGSSKPASQLPVQGTPLLASSPQWQGQEIPPAREHQSHHRAHVVGFACPPEVADSHKVQGILEFSPIILEFKS